MGFSAAPGASQSIFKQMGVVLLVANNNAGFVPFKLFGAVIAKVYYNYSISDIKKSCRGAENNNFPAFGRGGNNIGFNSLAVGNIGHKNLFVSRNTSLSQDIRIDSDAAGIINLCLCNACAVDFAFKRSYKHLRQFLKKK
jgi:hypothetical protein